MLRHTAPFNCSNFSKSGVSGRIGLDQAPHECFKLVCRLPDAQRGRIDYDEIKRVRLPPKIRGPLIHPGVGKLGLLPWTAQPRATYLRRTIEQDDVNDPRRRSCYCFENEAGARLPVEDRKADIVGETAKLHEPLAGR